MKLKQDGCDICGEMEPLQSMLFNDCMHDLCKICWDWVTSREGD